jgi:hypothetical protein
VNIEDENLYPKFRVFNNKQIDVCWEMMDKMGYPKLELGLSLMLKDHLTDCLTYNSLKVCVYFSLLSFDNYFR